MATWSLVEAQRNFDELLGKAISEGEQYITRDGHVVAVVVTKEHWDSLGRSEPELAQARRRTTSEVNVHCRCMG